MHGVRPVRPIDRPAAVGERRHAAHLFRRANSCAGLQSTTRSTRPVSVWRVASRFDEPGAREHQRAVVLREAFGEPQLARHVRAVEIERLERARPDALDVPAVEELVRHRVEQLRAIAARCVRRRGHHRAVAVLHAVVVGVRQVVGEKRVVARARTRGTRRRPRLPVANDLLDVLRRSRRAPRRCPCDARQTGTCGRPTVNCRIGDRAELRRAVHQVLKIRRGELERRRAGMQLRRDLPRRCAGRLRERQRQPADRRGRAPT